MPGICFLSLSAGSVRRFFKKRPGTPAAFAQRGAGPSLCCLQRELHSAEGCVDRQQQNALRTVQLALAQGGDREDQHNSQHDRQLQHKAGVDAEQSGALRNGEGGQRNRNAADQHQIKDIGADNIAQRDRCDP